MNTKIDLTELLEKIYQKVTKEVTEACYNNTVNDVLKKYGLEDEIEYCYYDISNSKILIVGNSMIDKDIMVAIAKRNGIKENRLEFRLDYDRLHNYDFGNLKDNMNYSDVLVGPLPHKVEGIDGYSSFLAMAEAEPDRFPKITRLESANELKITKESFTNGILNTRFYNDMYC